MLVGEDANDLWEEETGEGVDLRSLTEAERVLM